MMSISIFLLLIPCFYLLYRQFNLYAPQTATSVLAAEADAVEAQAAETAEDTAAVTEDTAAVETGDTEAVTEEGGSAEDSDEAAAGDTETVTGDETADVEDQDAAESVTDDEAVVEDVEASADEEAKETDSKELVAEKSNEDLGNKKWEIDFSTQSATETLNNWTGGTDNIFSIVDGGNKAAFKADKENVAYTPGGGVTYQNNSGRILNFAPKEGKYAKVTVTARSSNDDKRNIAVVREDSTLKTASDKTTFDSIDSYTYDIQSAPDTTAHEYVFYINDLDTSKKYGLAMANAFYISKVVVEADYALSKVTADHDTSAAVADATSIELSSQEGATIYWTYGETAPAKDGDKYKADNKYGESNKPSITKGNLSVTAVAVLEKADGTVIAESDPATFTYTVTDGPVAETIEVAVPAADVSAGVYDDPQNISLSSDTKTSKGDAVEVDIYYTIDGTNPLTSATVQKFDKAKAITIDKTTTVKAYAKKDKEAEDINTYTDSAVATFIYVIKQNAEKTYTSNPTKDNEPFFDLERTSNYNPTTPESYKDGDEYGVGTDDYFKLINGNGKTAVRDMTVLTDPTKLGVTSENYYNIEALTKSWNDQGLNELIGTLDANTKAISLCGGAVSETSNAIRVDISAPAKLVVYYSGKNPLGKSYDLNIKVIAPEGSSATAKEGTNDAAYNSQIGKAEFALSGAGSYYIGFAAQGGIIPYISVTENPSESTAPTDKTKVEFTKTPAITPSEKVTVGTKLTVDYAITEGATDASEIKWERVPAKGEATALTADAGSDNKTYTVTAADVDNTIRVTVTPKATEETYTDGDAKFAEVKVEKESTTPPATSDTDTGDVTEDDVDVAEEEFGYIPNGLWIAGFEGYWNDEGDNRGFNYTGSAIKPSVRVYYGTKRLYEKTDYTVSYKNNVKVPQEGASDKKLPTITVKGKGNYSGTATKTFKIIPYNIEYCYYDDNTMYLYSGKTQKPVPTISGWMNGKSKKLKNKTDFEVGYYKADDTEFKNELGSVKDAGDYKIEVKGIKNYTGKFTIDLTLKDSSESTLVSKLSIKAAAVDYDADKAKDGITTTVTVKKGKTVLTEGTDYTLEYWDNYDAGTASVRVIGNGTTYVGSKKVNFKINGTPLSKAKITLKDGFETYNRAYCTGTDDEIYDIWSQSFKIEKDGTELKEETDYSYYDDIINGRKVTLYFEGRGQYSGSVKKTFTLKQSVLDDGTGEDAKFKYEYNEEDNPYSKAGVKPSITVTDKEGNKLVAGVDYSVSYKNNKAVATKSDTKAPAIVIKGKGCYKGTVNKTFTIVKKDISEP